jgi:hypothetical protein
MATATFRPGMYAPLILSEKCTNGHPPVKAELLGAERPYRDDGYHDAIATRPVSATITAQKLTTRTVLDTNTVLTIRTVLAAETALATGTILAIRAVLITG